MMTTSTDSEGPREQLACQTVAHVNQQQLPPQPKILQLAAASLATGEKDELEAEFRRSQRLRKQIDQLKMSIPAIEQQQQQPRGAVVTSAQEKQQQQPATTAIRSERFAPLASLDFSITADTTTSFKPNNNDNNNQPERVAKSNEADVSHSSSSTFETPTLSGYFDCDELSDMVDGSLFEITNAGCLSRSVFGDGPVRAQVEWSGRPDNDKGDTTPTNDVRAPESKKPPPDTGVQRPRFEFRPETIRGHDYSSTSSVPNHAKSHSGAAAASTNQAKVIAAAATTTTPCNKQLTNPRRHYVRGATRPKRTSASETDDTTADLDVGVNSPGGAKQAPRARSKSNSMLNRRTEIGDDVLNRRCPLCCGHEQTDRVANKKQGKRRFTFSLFNLFGGGGSNTNQAHNMIAACHHDHNLMQPTNQINGDAIKLGNLSGKSVPKRRRHGKATSSQQRNCVRSSQTSTTSKGGPMPTMRLRDSIKITNQRKQRLNKPKAQLDSETLDGTLQRSSEVLLDLSEGRHPSRPMKSQSATNITTKNKSVKFTTPDRVMFLSPEPPASDHNNNNNTSDNNGNSNHQQRRLGHLSGSQSNSQLANSMPAPIIKRPNVPKSSSYSQTEPNKGLDELLAKYEQNNQLVAEINEKLHLSERISSNKSILDRSLSSSSSLPSQEDPKTTIPILPSELVNLPDGQLQMASAEQTSRQLIEFETEDVDEELLEALHRRLDALDAEAEQAEHDDTGDVLQPHEDFSNCDCNSAEGGFLVNQTNANKISTTIQNRVANTIGDKT